MIWALALALLFRYTLVSASARYVLVTGESLLQGYSRIGNWLVWTALAATILVRHSTNLYIVVLMGSAAHTLCPLPFAASAVVWSLVFTAVGFVMMFWGGYPAMERACKALVALLGVSLVAAALLSRPDPAAILQGILIPRIPNNQGLYSAVLLLAAMIGAQAGTMSNLSYAYFVEEKGWRGTSFLGQQRFDLLVGTACKFILGALLQIAAAGTLFPLGIEPKSAEHLVRIFTDTQGAIGRIIFGLGLWAVSFSTFVGGTIGYSLIIRDICRRFVPRLADGGTPDARRDPVYRWSVALLAFSPLYVLFTKVEPVSLALTVRALVVVVIPILAVSLLRLTNDSALMGRYRNSWLTNLVMGLMVLVSLYLTGRNGLDWWHKLRP
jgi:Mn2+/Fe2+ NRAMP family transporter